MVVVLESEGGGDDDGWGDPDHGYGLRLRRNSVALCFAIEFLNYGFGLSELPLHEVITQSRVINSDLKVMSICLCIVRVVWAQKG